MSSNRNWTCAVCTFLNSTSSNTCEMCDSERAVKPAKKKKAFKKSSSAPSEEESKEQTAGQEPTFKESNIVLWKCGRCFKENDSSSSVCQVCGAFQPSSACFIQPTVSTIFQMYDSIQVANKMLDAIQSQVEKLEESQEFESKTVPETQSSGVRLLKSLQMLEIQYFSSLNELSRATPPITPNAVLRLLEKNGAPFGVKARCDSNSNENTTLDTSGIRIFFETLVHSFWIIESLLSQHKVIGSTSNVTSELGVDLTPGMKKRMLGVIQSLQDVVDVRSAFSQQNIVEQFEEFECIRRKLNERCSGFRYAVDTFCCGLSSITASIDSFQSTATKQISDIGGGSKEGNEQSTNAPNKKVQDSQSKGAPATNLAEENSIFSQTDPNLNVTRASLVAALSTFAKSMKRFGKMPNVCKSTHRIGRLAPLQSEPSESWRVYEQSWRMGSTKTGAWVMDSESNTYGDKIPFWDFETKEISMNLRSQTERRRGYSQQLRLAVAKFLHLSLPQPDAISGSNMSEASIGGDNNASSSSESKFDEIIDQKLEIIEREEANLSGLSESDCLTPTHIHFSKVLEERSTPLSIIELKPDAQHAFYIILSLFDSITSTINDSLSSLVAQAHSLIEQSYLKNLTFQRKFGQIRELIAPLLHGYSYARTSSVELMEEKSISKGSEFVAEWGIEKLGKVLQTSQLLSTSIVNQIHSIQQIKAALESRKGSLLSHNEHKSFRNRAWIVQSKQSSGSSSIEKGKWITMIDSEIEECSKAIESLMSYSKRNYILCEKIISRTLTVDESIHVSTSAYVAYSRFRRCPSSISFFKFVLEAGLYSPASPSSFQLVSLPEHNTSINAVRTSLLSKGMLYQADIFPFSIQMKIDGEALDSSEDSSGFLSPSLQLIRNAVASQLDEDTLNHLSIIEERAPLSVDNFASSQCPFITKNFMLGTKHNKMSSPIPLRKIVRILIHGHHVIVLRKLPEFGTIFDLTIRARSHELLYGLPTLNKYLDEISGFCRGESVSNELFPSSAIESWKGMSPSHVDIPPSMIHSCAHRLIQLIADVHSHGLVHGNITWNSFEFDSLSLNDISATNAGSGLCDDSMSDQCDIETNYRKGSHSLAEDFFVASGGIHLRSLPVRSNAHPATHFAAPLSKGYMSPLTPPPTLFSYFTKLDGMNDLSDYETFEVDSSDTRKFCDMMRKNPQSAASRFKYASISSMNVTSQFKSHWSLAQVALLRPSITDLYFSSPIERIMTTEQESIPQSVPLTVSSRSGRAKPRPHPVFSAPETQSAFEKSRDSPNTEHLRLSQKTDVWSVGILLYFMYFVAPLASALHARVLRRLRTVGAHEQYIDFVKRRSNEAASNGEQRKENFRVDSLEGLLTFPSVFPMFAPSAQSLDSPKNGASNFRQFWSNLTDDFTLSSAEKLYAIASGGSSDSQATAAQREVVIDAVPPAPWPPKIDFSKGEAILPTLADLARHPDTALLLGSPRGIVHVLSVIKACLSFNPRDRPSMEDILRSPLFGGVPNWSSVASGGARLPQRTLSQLYTLGPLELRKMPGTVFFGSSHIDREQILLSLYESGDKTVAPEASLLDPPNMNAESRAAWEQRVQGLNVQEIKELSNIDSDGTYQQGVGAFSMALGEMEHALFDSRKPMKLLEVEFEESDEFSDFRFENHQGNDDSSDDYRRDLYNGSNFSDANESDEYDHSESYGEDLQLNRTSSGSISIVSTSLLSNSRDNSGSIQNSLSRTSSRSVSRIPSPQARNQIDLFSAREYESEFQYNTYNIGFSTSSGERESSLNSDTDLLPPRQDSDSGSEGLTPHINEESISYDNEYVEQEHEISSNDEHELVTPKNCACTLSWFQMLSPTIGVEYVAGLAKTSRIRMLQPYSTSCGMNMDENPGAMLPILGVFAAMPIVARMDMRYSINSLEKECDIVKRQGLSATLLRYYGDRLRKTTETALFKSENIPGLCQVANGLYRCETTSNRQNSDALHGSSVSHNAEAFFITTPSSGARLTSLSPELLYKIEPRYVACFLRHSWTVHKFIKSWPLISITPLSAIIRSVQKSFSHWRMRYASESSSYVQALNLPSRSQCLRLTLDVANNLNIGSMFNKFSTTYEGETGFDMGGITTDLYTEVFTQAALPVRKLFELHEKQSSMSDTPNFFCQFSHQWLLGPIESIGSLIASAQLDSNESRNSLDSSSKVDGTFIKSCNSHLPLYLKHSLPGNTLLPYALSRVARQAYESTLTMTESSTNSHVSKSQRFEYLATLRNLGKLLVRTMLELSPVHFPLHPAVLHFLLMPSLLPRPQVWHDNRFFDQGDNNQKFTSSFCTPHLFTSLLWREFDLIAYALPSHRKLLSLTSDELESLDLDFSDLPLDAFELLTPAVAQRLFEGIIPATAYLAIPLPDCPPVADWSRTSYAQRSKTILVDDGKNKLEMILSSERRQHVFHTFNGDPFTLASAKLNAPGISSSKLSVALSSGSEAKDGETQISHGTSSSTSTQTSPLISSSWKGFAAPSKLLTPKPQGSKIESNSFEPSVFVQFKAQIPTKEYASADDILPHYSTSMNWMPSSWVSHVGESLVTMAAQKIKVNSNNVHIFVELMTAKDLFLDRWDELCALRDGFQMAPSLLPLLRSVDLPAVAEWFGKGGFLPISRVCEVFVFNSSWDGVTSSTKEDFLHIVENDLNDRERRQLLRLCTSLCNLPYGEETVVEVGRIIYRTDLLPVGHTCFRTLDLPDYDDYEVLLEKLRIALSHIDVVGFGYS